MKKVTKNTLKKLNACNDGFDFWAKNCEDLPTDEQILKLHNSGNNDWANWLMVRIMTRKQRIVYSVFCAEQVIGNYEKIYPDDKRPRLAIEAAKLVLKRNTEKNRSAAWSAWSAAQSAARSAVESAESAAWSAAVSYTHLTLPTNREV